MPILNKNLKRKIIELSYQNKLSHIGSCLTSVDIIADIYKAKDPKDIFVLSAGHAALAWYVVLEEVEKKLDLAQKLLDTCGTHPDRLKAKPLTSEISTSTGSLGHGVGIAVGMAMANRSRNVFCMATDGECAEGSVIEALNIARIARLTNFYLYINANGYSAYREVDIPVGWGHSEFLQPKATSVFAGFNINIVRTDCSYIPFLAGLPGHYKVMSADEYKIASEILKDD
jgi:transketolase